jgi:hypothetical protein
MSGGTGFYCFVFEAFGIVVQVRRSSRGGVVGLERGGRACRKGFRLCFGGVVSGYLEQLVKGARCLKYWGLRLRLWGICVDG